MAFFANKQIVIRNLQQCLHYNKKGPVQPSATVIGKVTVSWSAPYYLQQSRSRIFVSFELFISIHCSIDINNEMFCLLPYLLHIRYQKRGALSDKIMFLHAFFIILRLVHTFLCTSKCSTGCFACFIRRLGNTLCFKGYRLKSLWIR